MTDLISYAHGIHAIDTRYTRHTYDAAHLLVEGDRAAFIDAGINASVPQMLATLDRFGIPRGNVDFVILTHIHLDHAGGAGLLMRELPHARLVVHPRGVRHMADPSKLIAATHEVYGKEKAEALYGEILPVPADRIDEAPHETTVLFGHRELLLLDTPGHAKHHLVVHDSASGNLFTGDTFGLSYRHLDANGRQFIYPTTSPSQFDPAALHRSVDLIASFKPEAVYVTHYSEARDVQRLAADMHRLIDAQLEIALREKDAGPECEQRIAAAIRQLALAEAAQQGWALQGEAALELLSLDLELNAQGLCIWLDAQSVKPT
jgi:glyoxylase-like metal-dependent hydrolase (beta-lactamase superfamily II)